MLNTDIGYKLAAEVVTNLRKRLLPIHITADQIREMFGDDAPTFHAHFNEINEIMKKTMGIHGEIVLWQAHSRAPQTVYYTFYREGQKSLFLTERTPEAGPYFIPDDKRC